MDMAEWNGQRGFAYDLGCSAYQMCVPLRGRTAPGASSLAPGAAQGVMAHRGHLRFGLGYLPIDGETDNWWRSILEWSANSPYTAM